MNFNLSDEQEMLREAARRFAEERFSFEQTRRGAGRKFGSNPECWQAFADMGWLALGLPEDVEGLNCSFVETAILSQEFGRALVGEPYVSSAILCARILERSSNLALRSASLSAIGQGTARYALAHSEAGMRYSRCPSATMAARDARGGFILDGAKTLAFDAPSADRLIVSARLDGDMALLVIEAASLGVSISPYEMIDGTWAADVRFDSVQLAGDALVSHGDTAHAALDEALDRAALAQVAESLGSMEAILDITNAYLKQRMQFGQIIGKFQALQHRMAEMFVEVQATRSMLYRGLSLIDGSAGDRRSGVAAAKVVAGNAARFVGTQGIQLHGGIGMTDEYVVGHHYKKLLALGKRYGDASYYLDRFAAGGAS